MDRIKKLKQRIWKDMPAYLFVLPAILLYALFSIKPMIRGLIYSFYDIGLREETFVGFANYMKLAQDPLFWMEIKNTLIFVAIIVPLTLALSLGIALMIFRFGHVIQSILRGAFYIPSISAGVVMSIVWLWIFHPLYGLANYLLSLLGLRPVFWLSDPNYARIAVSMVVLNWVIGVNVILYLAALARIPKTIYESAQIDGAGSLKRFSKITLPLISPMTAYVMMTTTIGIFVIWAAIFLLTGGGPNYATTSIVYRIYNLGFIYYRFGEASAHAVVLLLIVLPVAFLQFKYLHRRLEF